MPTESVLPELKEILGALIFGSNRPLGLKEMRQCLVEVAKNAGGETTAFGEVKDGDIREAMEYLKTDLERQKCGFLLVEVAGGFRFQSSGGCGRWLRHLLNAERPNRLSQPGLETLAIIAYRQPVSKSEIEGVRGVNVDHIIKALLEMQLVRIVGRSDLPGRPFLFGTTQTFLEHFGLKDLNDLRQMEPMLLRERERKRIEQRLADGAKTVKPAAGEGGPPAVAMPEDPAGGSRQPAPAAPAETVAAAAAAPTSEGAGGEARKEEVESVNRDESDDEELKDASDDDESEDDEDEFDEDEDGDEDDDDDEDEEGDSR